MIQKMSGCVGSSKTLLTCFLVWGNVFLNAAQAAVPRVILSKNDQQELKNLQSKFAPTFADIEKTYTSIQQSTKTLADLVLARSADQALYQQIVSGLGKLFSADEVKKMKTDLEQKKSAMEGYIDRLSQTAKSIDRNKVSSDVGSILDKKFYYWKKRAENGLHNVNNALKPKKSLSSDDLREQFEDGLPRDVQFDFEQQFLPAIEQFKKERDQALKKGGGAQSDAQLRESAQAAVIQNINNGTRALNQAQQEALRNFLGRIFEVGHNYMDFSVVQLNDEIEQMDKKGEQIINLLGSLPAAGRKEFIAMLRALMGDFSAFIIDDKLRLWSPELIDQKEKDFEQQERILIGRSTGLYESLSEKDIMALQELSERAHDIALQAALAYEPYRSSSVVERLRPSNLVFSGTVAWADYKKLENLFIAYCDLINKRFETLDARAKKMIKLQEAQAGSSTVKQIGDMIKKTIVQQVAQRSRLMGAVQQVFQKESLNYSTIEPKKVLQDFERLLGYYIANLMRDVREIQARYSRFNIINSSRPVDPFKKTKSFFVTLMEALLEKIKYT